jgi:hypothetical protein
LGGTTSSSSEGTIEFEIYVPSWLNSIIQPIVFWHNSIEIGSNYDRIGIYHYTGDKWYFLIANHAGTSSYVSQTDNNTGWRRMTMAWKSSILDATIQGVSVGTPVTNPNLPTARAPNNIYLGHSSAGGGTYQVDMPIRKLHISRRYMSISERATRDSIVANGGSYTVTKDTTFYIDGQYDIRGYKIAAGG